MAGYYTLLGGQVEREGATCWVSAGTSTRFPIPVCLLARLAVNHEEQGRGLGARLLLDALERTVRASHDIAIRAVVVQAIDPALGMDRGDGRGPALVANAMLGADKWRGDVPVPQRVSETRYRRAGRWYLGSAMTKTELHRLVDALPDESLDAAAVLLVRARDPVVAKLDAAPYDDEELTEEDQEAIREGLSEQGIPWSEVESELRAD